MKRSACCLLALLTGGVVAYAADTSLDRGKELFESPKLGTSGKSCSSCHPGGRKLEWAASTYDDEKLTEIVNRCIEKSLKGKPLDPASDDMKSLIAYIKTFGAPGK
ncbi:c-type cytochrome [Geobacter pickeringii]|uniref:Cytochrome C n=1 Tax=Geobacter pickeringii TaxID=345632 RepID=A0A0B5B9U8_9BACT|nr:cytochrome c [Geobacter pickeringii]AJE03347.1 cytochrome C [Geobacter pickeringii]